MIFFSLLAVLAIVHWWPDAALLQRDGWFVWLLNRCRKLPAAASFPLLPMILVFAIPLGLLIVAILAIVYFLSANFLFFLYVPVLLYSLGRGNFINEVRDYIHLAERGDTVAASRWVEEMGGRALDTASLTRANDWKGLHTQALKVIAYRGFERCFAVIFWFVIAGALGALLYRLSVIYREHTVSDTSDAELADKWLWLIELPAVRLMGLTWAFVGNFDSCPWRESLLDTVHTSIHILNNSLRGALSAPVELVRPSEETPVETVVVDEELAVEVVAEAAVELPVDSDAAAALDREADEIAQDVLEDLTGTAFSPHTEPAYSFALVKSSVPLYSRSLLFWVGAIAFATLFI
jgi:AmpE protein